MPTQKRNPRLYIIAGPNGAGKTTFATRFLPHYAECTEFVNADLIASGLSPFAPEAAAFRAGRLMLEQIRTLAGHRRDFAFETTLSGRTYLPLLRDMKGDGYSISPFFLWLPSVDLSIARIANRVREGGHNIPEPVVRRRFAKGIKNLFHQYRLVLDSWTIIDNSEDPPCTIASEVEGKIRVADEALYGRIRSEVDAHEKS